ncbi:MAG: PD40 domain-containing protein, partial [Chloroflexi bacterium]|nr:PD40 domain-containing protein [Chloroflexota bacterium]
FPAWSPDGKKIAFVELKVENGEPSAALYTADRDGKNLVQAFSDPKTVPFYLYWSPDNHNVSFLSSNTGSAGLKLQLVPAAGGDAKTLDVGQPYYWSWSPNGRQVLVHVGGAAVDSGAHLSLLGIDGDVSESGLDYKPTYFQAPAWSPDGKHTLYAAETDNGRVLILADSAGAEQSQLATFEGGIAFGWAPDGKHVAYITGDAESLGILGTLSIVNPQKPAEAKSVENKPVMAFFWSPDSKQLAYFVPEIVAPTPEPGQQSSGNSQFLVLHLFVASAGDAKSHSVATFIPTRDFYNLLPYFDQYQQSATLWSPDSQNLVLSAFSPTASGDAKPGVFVVHSSGNLEPRFLKEGTLGLWSPK